MKIIAFPILLTLLLLSGISHAQDSTTARISGADVVSLRCEGTCDCSLEGILDTKVQCTCNECTKVITITESGLQGETSATIYNLEDASIEVPLVEEFFDYTDSSGGGIILEDLELYRNGDDVAVLFMYLNPAQDKIAVRSEAQEVQIFDLWGKKVIQVEMLVANEEISITELSNGVYIVQLQTSDGDLVRQSLVVQK